MTACGLCEQKREGAGERESALLSSKEEVKCSEN